LYNFKRPHEAIQMATPASRYRPSARRMPATLPALEYGPHDIVRRVSKNGRISLGGRNLSVSKALVGQDVALRPHTDLDGSFNVYFCHQKITTIDLAQRC
jgi:hypothetical protein